MFGPGVAPIQRWIMPTNTMSLAGSTQNHVPAMPVPEERALADTAAHARSGSSKTATS